MATMAREVTAKLTVRSVNSGKDQSIVEFFAKYDDERNKAWAPFTPAANLQMYVKPEIAAEHFPLGRNFLVTFTPED